MVPLPSSTVGSSPLQQASLMRGRSLFVYGTLMSPLVTDELLSPPPRVVVPMSTTAPPPSVVTTSRFSRLPARLYGYKRSPIPEAVYPGIVPSAVHTVGSASGKPGQIFHTHYPSLHDSDFVDGVLLFPLTSRDWRILDWFEGVTTTTTTRGGSREDADNQCGDEYTRTLCRVQLLSTRPSEIDKPLLAIDTPRSNGTDTPSATTPPGESVDRTPESWVETQVYVWNLASRASARSGGSSAFSPSSPITEDWSFAHFLDRHLSHFLAHTVQPCRNELQQLGYYHNDDEVDDDNQQA